MDPQSPDVTSSGQFLVCGLGGLGQHCVAILKEFGVEVGAMDKIAVADWEIPQLRSQLTHLWVGDCRQTEDLTRAQVQYCRGILLVTGDERVNVEAAFAARLLNPNIRLVVRSAKQNLNQLLEQQLGNFVAFEPTQLSAPAFALAALEGHTVAASGVPDLAPEEILGFFEVEGELLQVVKRQIQLGDRWCNVRQLHELNSRTRCVLCHFPSPSAPTPLGLDAPHKLFYQWWPDRLLQANDCLITIELTQGLSRRPQQLLPTKTPHPLEEQRWRLHQLWRWLQQTLGQWWQTSSQHQIQRVAWLCLLTVVLLWGGGTLLFHWYYPDIQLLDAFYATAVLLLGGYGDLFSEVQLTLPIPWWLRFFGLLLTLSGTAFIGVLYALLTQRLLSWRLQFLAKRPPLPDQNHVVVIGLGRVGQRVVTLLQTLKQPLVGIARNELDPQTLPQTPLVIGTVANALAQVNLATAKSVVAVTEDEMENLEMGLMAHAANPSCGLAIRTYDNRFTDKVAQLFPYAHVLCASAFSAEAFVAAAFGENVLSLFRIQQQTVLVTDYDIEAGDTLNGLILAEIAYGYGVVPLWHQRSSQDSPTLMPSHDLHLRVGDRLIVLATIEGLRRVEQGDRLAKRWQIQVEKAWTPDGAFNGATEIARTAGCPLSMARELMARLPGMLPHPLYYHQALRLQRRLRRLQVESQVLPLDTGIGTTRSPNGIM